MISAKAPRKSALGRTMKAVAIHLALASGADPEQVKTMCATVDAYVPMLTPEQDEAILRDAGFSDVTLFYAAFTWRGWIANA